VTSIEGAASSAIIEIAER
jgi:hypothetical protein